MRLPRGRSTCALSSELKRAVKMFCVREETTEQSWEVEVIEGELKRRALDLWNGRDGTKKKGR